MGELLTRPAARVSGDRIEELRRLRYESAKLDDQIDVLRELESRRLDALLRRNGFEVRPRERWPSSPLSAEQTGETLYRGPEQWGDLVRAYIV
jgi:hypothetical protein